jgi:PII-like signaling protein
MPGHPSPETAALHHGLAGEQTLMRIHIGEADRFEGEPLYEKIVALLRGRGLAGATVTQCIMGFGRSRRMHSVMSDLSALDLPVVVECVESEERIQTVLPDLDGMIGGGLITLERAAVITYRSPASEQGSGGARP